MVALSVFLALAVAAPQVVTEGSGASDEPEQPAKKPAEPPSHWSTELMDPHAMTLLGLVTRVTFSDGDSVISRDSAWSYEARFQLSVSESVALTAVAPLGLTSRRSGETAPFFGNVAVGMTVGGNLTSGPGPKFRLGGGLDFYLPTAPEPATEDAAIDRSVVAAIRAYEPQLYVPKMIAGRIRVHGEVAIDALEAELEVGLVPGGSLAKDKGFIFLLGVAARGSYAVSPNIEPFLEIACTPQLGGTGEISPPLLLTPGVRFHIADVFDPSLFLSFNFVAPSAIVFGVDLATFFRPSTGPKKSREKDPEDFLGDF